MMLFSTALMLSCTNEDIEQDKNENRKSTEYSEEQIVLGEKLPNPYNIDNMKEAYNELFTAGSITNPINIIVTDLYVRFLPKDSIDLKFLYEEKELILFEYPLDYDIEKAGSYYHDPSISNDDITWLYTTVKPDFEFPSSMQYEVLDRCFIPRDEGKEGVLSSLDILEQKTFERVGLLEKFQPEESDTKGWFSGYKPKGTFKVYDTDLNRLEGIKGVKVKCNLIVKCAYANTNENGYYSMSTKFALNPFYTISFSNTMDFTIWNNYIPITAFYYMGVHSRKGHNHDLYTNSVGWGLSTINNAAYDYYANLCLGQNPLTSPPSKLKILQMKDYSKSSASMIRRINHLIYINSPNPFVTLMSSIYSIPANMLLKFVQFGLPDITIGAKSNLSKSIYSSTVHELAHASHFSQVGSNYWSQYVNYIITCYVNGLDTYGNIDSPNSGICGVGEMWGYAIGNLITKERYSLVQSEQGFYYWFKPQIIYKLITDSRTSLSPYQIFYCLTEDITSHQLLKSKLKYTYPVVSRGIEEIFNEENF